MADELQTPPLPPAGTIVTEAALYNTQITNWRNTIAYGGQKNPTAIWSSMLRDDGLAIPYYREIEEKDTDVANALDSLRDSVLKREHWVTPADESGHAQDVADFVQAQFDGIPDFDRVLSNLLDAPGYGFSLGELIFDVSMGQASLIDVLDCPQELFLFGNRFQPQIGQLQFLTQVMASEGTPVPEEKFLIWSYRMRSRNRMGRPLIRSVFWPSWFKRNMQRLWVRYAEKGPGTAAVKYKDAASQQEQQQAAELAYKLIDQVAVGIPENFQFVEELMKGARPIPYEVYEHFTEAMQLDIVRRVLGETLTSFGAEKGRGTQALGQQHAESLDDKSVQLCKALAGVVNRQFVRNIVLWNFGPDAPMPTWGCDIEEEKDLTERLAIDKGLQTMGVPMPLSYLQTTYSVPAPEPTDTIAQPSAAAGAFTLPTITPSFSEDGRATGEAQLAQFDDLKGQLDKAAEVLMKERVREFADALGSAAGK